MAGIKKLIFQCQKPHVILHIILNLHRCAAKIKIEKRAWNIHGGYFYFTRQEMVKYCNRAWKKVVFASFFRNISKTAETIWIKKIGRNHGISVYKKAFISEHRKNYVFRDINYFVKMYVFQLVGTHVTNFCERASSKTS